MEPLAQGTLPPEDGHEVAWYEFGNPAGTPLLFLHGGPGSGFKRDYLDFFPLERVRLLTLDQRGCGQSRPFAGLAHNTTAALLSDIERLRVARGVERWIVAGHSWGATLSLIYAKAQPARCSKLLLASFFGAQPEDQRWTFEDIRLFFPEEVEALQALKPAGETRPFREWICDALAGPEQKEVAYRLSRLAGLSARMTPKLVQREEIDDAAIGRWQVLFHYGQHDFFLTPGTLTEDLSALTMPAYALHGRFDMDCPIAQVLRLKRALPLLELRIVAGNHSCSEEPMAGAFKALAAEVC